MKIIDITGQRFGRLTIDSFAYTKNNRAYWNCTCDCGTPCVKMGKYLRNGDTKSCGCLAIEKARQMGEANINRNKYEILEDGKTVKVYFNNTDNYFLCDLDDWVPVEDFLTWYETEHGYARAQLNDNSFVFFHSYVLNTYPTKNCICDHINRNRLDNRKINLRLVTNSENNINQKTYKNNKSGHTGVFYNNEIHKWESYIDYKKQRIELGYFKKYEEAVDARERAEKKYFGFIKEKGINPMSDNQYAERL